MSGFAITAGSKPTLLAKRGRLLPTSFAIIIVPTSVSENYKGNHKCVFLTVEIKQKQFYKVCRRKGNTAKN